MDGTRATIHRHQTVAVAGGAMILLGLMAIIVTYRIGGDYDTNDKDIVKGTAVVDTEPPAFSQSPAIATVLAYRPGTTGLFGSDRSPARRESIQLKPEDEANGQHTDVRLGLARHDRVSAGGRDPVPIVESEATDP